MSDDLITVRDLTKTYGSEEALLYALAGVNLNIRRGEFAAIMGPSGSGKSTLMNILGCLDRPTAGTYLLDGEDVSQLSKPELADARNRKIGFVFQSFNLLPRLPAYKNVMLPMMYYRGESRPDLETREARAVAALEAVGLGDRLEHYPNQLSGGQQQRVAIARALINNPALILADEPTGNLDSHSSEDILALIDRLHEQGATILMVTHAPDVAKHAERIICLRDGQLVSDGRSDGSECIGQGGMP